MSKVSGVTIPLFSIRTRNDWGIGQITDLPTCAAWVLRAGQRLLQVLPTHELSQGETSPYGALSAFALDPIYIDVDKIPDLDPAAITRRLGDEGQAELDRARRSVRVDYKAVRTLKRRAFSEAFACFHEHELTPETPRGRVFLAFVEREGPWLRDHALYIALRASHDGHGWSTWPREERERDAKILDLATARRDDGGIGTRVIEQMYLQWIAHEQWHAARVELKQLGVSLMGDMPFIVGSESGDVWAHRDQFRTDVSLGAPPDDFAKDGQSWGLPVYDWATMDKDDLAWLRMRAKHASMLFDRFRIDHLVGFFRQWVTKEGERGAFVPPGEKEQRARGEKVLRAMLEAAGPGSVIAEDLGVIPSFVREIMGRLGLPGYKVLPWEKDEAFMSKDPRAFSAQSVATWSTHDTPPITSWWDDLQPWERERLAALDDIPLDLAAPARDLALLKLLFSAGSDLTLVLVNELIGDKARINTPGSVNDDNWTWRLPRPIEELREDPELVARFDAIRALVETSGRL